MFNFEQKLKKYIIEWFKWFKFIGNKISDDWSFVHKGPALTAE